MEPVKISYHFTLKIEGTKSFGSLHKLTKRTLEKNANKKTVIKFCNIIKVRKFKKKHLCLTNAANDCF